jgi:gamma-glutamyl-gamma-aminobutyraldehyde dehydrogenase
VVVAILPWNFPLMMLAWKIGPALASGCSIIVKPAEQTSLTALRVAELAHEAGIPRGVLQVLPGDGPSVGEPLGRHMDVDMVSFTGSTETGRRFLQYAADSNLKKVVLECGGKNPALVFDDVENLDLVAEHVVNGAFWNAGQNCSATSRLIVHSAVKAALLDKINARIREWKVGNPLDPANHIGALIDKDHCSKVRSYLDDEGDGPFISPTVFEVEADDRRARDEIFGPVLCVITVDNNDKAVQVANDTDYGLTASLFSAGSRSAIRAARDIRAGTVTVNCYGEGNIATPFGGYKHSGFGGRDNGLHAHNQYTETKTIWIDLNDPADGNNVT